MGQRSQHRSGAGVADNDVAVRKDFLLGDETLDADVLWLLAEPVDVAVLPDRHDDVQALVAQRRHHRLQDAGRGVVGGTQRDVRRMVVRQVRHYGGAWRCDRPWQRTLRPQRPHLGICPVLRTKVRATWPDVEIGLLGVRVGRDRLHAPPAVQSPGRRPDGPVGVIGRFGRTEGVHDVRDTDDGRRDIAGMLREVADHHVGPPLTGERHKIIGHYRSDDPDQSVHHKMLVPLIRRKFAQRIGRKAAEITPTDLGSRRQPLGHRGQPRGFHVFHGIGSGCEDHLVPRVTGRDGQRQHRSYVAA